jgi:AbrB family looped-hinge helix DNA binding protein
MEIITLSSKGQFVIPRDIREEMGLNQKDRFLLLHDKDNIILKKIKKEEVKEEMNMILKGFSDTIKQKGIRKSDIEEEIRKERG